MVEYNLSYEDETHPTSPHLFLKETTIILLGVLGVVILLLFFGNFISIEKEQNTWMTLKTQPISKWKLFLEKYKGILLTVLAFIILVIGMGIIVPLIFGDYPLNLLYPQVVITDDNFAVISTFQYMLRAIAVFICASVFVFSLVLFISKSVNNSFIVLMITGFILLAGFMITEFTAGLQSIWNPFQALHINSIIETVPQSNDWLYYFAPFMWSMLLIVFTLILPDREIRILNFSDRKNPFRSGKIQHHGKKLWSSILFESRKTKRKGLLRQATIFILLSIFISFIIVAQKEEDYINSLHETAKEISNVQIPYYESVINDKSVIAESFPGALELAKREVIIMKDALKAYDQGEWLPLLKYQLFKNKSWNGDFDEELNIDSGPVGGHFASHMTRAASITEKQWLIERNIQPIYSGEFIKTIYDKPEEADLSFKEYKIIWENWNNENEKLDASGLYILYYYFNKLIYVVPMVLLLFLFGAGISDEKGKSQTIRFLQTQPISKIKLFTGKLTYSLIRSVITACAFILIVVLIGTLFDHFGYWHYPILHYDSKSIVEAANYSGNIPSKMEVGYHFVSLGDVLLKNIALFLCMLVLILTIAQVFSLWFKNKLTVLASTIIFTVAGYVMSANLLESKAHLSPFTYFDISRITNGEISTVLDNPAVNVQYGVVVQLVSIFICLFIGYIFLFVKEKKS